MLIGYPPMSESDAERAVRIAREVLDGNTSAFLGCKQLLGPLQRLGVDREEPFITIVGVESELDGSPVWPDVRKLWNEQALAREDAKLAAWLPKMEPFIFEACRAVIRRFGDGG
jgi:hypothetical protein